MPAAKVEVFAPVVANRYRDPRPDQGEGRTDIGRQYGWNHGISGGKKGCEKGRKRSPTVVGRAGETPQSLRLPADFGRNAPAISWLSVARTRATGRRGV